MRVTAAAATIVAEVRLASGIRELANAHSTTVANDPHVPGAGFEASRAEESCDQRGPERGARRPRDSRRDAGATVVRIDWCHVLSSLRRSWTVFGGLLLRRR